MPIMRLILVMLAAASVAAFSADGDADSAYRILATYRLGGDGGWDLLTVDAAARRLYIARMNRVMLVDADSGALVAELPGHGVHGVGIDPVGDRGFFTNGADDTVTVFDRTTHVVIATVATGKKPDAIAVDGATGQVVVCDNGGSDLTLLSVADGSVIAHIEVGGAPELIALDGQGRAFTNLEDRDEVAVVDLRKRVLVAHWPLAPGVGPSGVAVDPKHHRLFSACHDSKTLEVLDADDGHHVASLPIGERCDGAVFDDRTDTIFVPNGGGTLSIIHEDDPDHFTTTTLPTRAGARTIAFDDQTRHLFLVTADSKAEDTQALPHGRPQYLPDTFSVVVVGR